MPDRHMSWNMKDNGEQLSQRLITGASLIFGGPVGLNLLPAKKN